MNKIIAKPFLKWVGGKRQLLSQFFDYYPKEIRTHTIQNYVEPFLGGGAVFFELSHKYTIQNAYLSDLNKDLVLAYKVVQEKPTELLELLAKYQIKYNETELENRKELFLEIRKEYNLEKSVIDYHNFADNWLFRTAKLIFLNRTCFNGLYRLNSKGEFNVPFGKYKKPKILNESNILAVSKVLQNAQIYYSDYSGTFDKIDENTFVYLDPPYRPINATSSFTTYTGFEFRDKEQLQLAEFFKKLDKEKNAKLMLSNSDPSNVNPEDNFFENAYQGYNIFKVSAGRFINSKGSKRGKIKELLITNYKYEPQTLEINF